MCTAMEGWCWGGQPPAKRLVLGGQRGGGVHIGRAVPKKLLKEDSRAKRAKLSRIRSAEISRPPWMGLSTLCTRWHPHTNNPEPGKMDCAPPQDGIWHCLKKWHL